MQKKRYIIILVLLLCRAGISIAQYDSIVKVNRVKYQQMHNRLEDYETVKSTFIIESGENVQGTAYYEGYDLKIIEVIYLSESGHKQMEYYFENGSLFFVLERKQPSEETVTLYIKGTKNNKTGTGASGNSGKTENRYYFYEDKLIRWYDNERKELDLKVGTNSIVGERLLTDAYKMKERLKKF
ncbi:MAG: hypothetical protein ABI855_10205 [Bacteroidota bacterium]